MSVPGFKREEVSFENVLNTVISQGRARPTAREAQIPPVRRTVAIANMSLDFNRATASRAQVICLYINGANGCSLSRMTAERQKKYTRVGDFRTDSSGKS